MGVGLHCPCRNRAVRLSVCLCLHLPLKCLYPLCWVCWHRFAFNQRIPTTACL
uniref:Uncharacterized protein n=1 Tax=Anguilla anguilla TaxID=7936 RepID=A0A0E9QPT1_ANGAN